MPAKSDKNQQQNIIKVWEPVKWLYTSQGSEKELIVTEGTAEDCFTFEQKVAKLSTDAAIDWLVSNKVTMLDGNHINLVNAVELGLTFPDKAALIKIIKMNQGLTVHPLDKRSEAETKIFNLSHEDSLTTIKFKCEDPPFNHRLNSSGDMVDALIDLSKENIVIEWDEYNLKPVKLGDCNLLQLPYFVADISILHFTQLMGRTPKKKILSKQ